MSYEGEDRRDRDRDPVMAQLMAIGKTVNDNHAATIKTLGEMNTAFQVHVTEDKAVAKTVADHEERWKDLDKMKIKGMFYAILAFILAGGAGGTAAHIAKKMVE